MLADGNVADPRRALPGGPRRTVHGDWHSAPVSAAGQEDDGRADGHGKDEGG